MFYETWRENAPGLQYAVWLHLAMRGPMPGLCYSNSALNFASHCGCEGQAGAVTRLPSTWA